MDEEQKIINGDVKELLKNHEARLDVANSEMSAVKEHLGTIRTDVDWLKQGLEKVDTRIWAVLSAVILGIVTQIILKVIGK